MKKVLLTLLSFLLVLLIAPMLLALLQEPERRQFDRVRLDDTVFSEVAFRNETQGLDLAGMLFVPDGEGPFPAAVIIHGSGTSRRDNGWYLTLAKYLQDRGVAVLLPDKRGSGRSGGDWRTASFQDLATDTLAALDHLPGLSPVPISLPGVIGLSQGGQVAPVAASMTDRLAFVINIVGGALPMHEQLVYEENHNLRQAGMLPGFSNLFARAGAWSLIRFRQKDFWAAVGNYDPLPYWRDIRVPSLVLYGADDTNVPSARSAENLAALGNPHIAVRVFEGSGHALESPEGVGTSILREDALASIADFIDAVGADAGRAQ